MRVNTSFIDMEALQTTHKIIAQPVTSVKSYAYVTKDIKKTLTITFLLTLINVVFYLALKFKYIAFLGIEF